MNRTLTVCRASAGTGKTYSLAANYVGLLFSGVSYRSILAVTFTNKATAEMKERILVFLNSIAHDPDNQASKDALKAARQRMIGNLKATDAELRRMADECYKSMLTDYDNIHISTIDRFMLRLLRGLSQMLGTTGASAEVELDYDYLVSRAVDRLLTDPDTGDPRDRLRYIAGEAVQSGKDWDIRRSLVSLAKEMYNEQVQVLETEGKVVFDSARILAYKKNVDWHNSARYPEFGRMQKLLKIVQPCADRAEIDKGRNYYSFITRISDSLKGRAGEPFKGLGERDAAALDGDGAKFMMKMQDAGRARLVCDTLREMNELCVKCRKSYIDAYLTTSLLDNMALMGDIRRVMGEILAEENRLLLAQTADILQRALKSGDADFILEKAGIRYRHIMIDEFQDTSALQWRNILPLVQDLLSQGGTTLVVGDIKQSIYRWRNGDWRIMQNLGRDKDEADPSRDTLKDYFTAMNLVRNHRSRRQVVMFNRMFFRRAAEILQAEVPSVADIYGIGLPDADEQQYYLPGNEGGHVEVHVEPKEKQEAQAGLTEMFSLMESLLEAGDKASNMMILIRYNREAEDVVAAFRALDAADFKKLKECRIVSCDSFHLESSVSVMTVINSLRYLVRGDAVAKVYLENVLDSTQTAALEAQNTGMPLVELINSLVQKLLPPDLPDLAYINALLDQTRDYVGRYGSDNEMFLRFWDDCMHSMAVSAPEGDAIRIMTVHSAKGLQAKNVFLPFFHWKLHDKKGYLWQQAGPATTDGTETAGYIPVTKNSSLLDESVYAQAAADDRQAETVDNMNLMYVALTRAEENMYIRAVVPEKQIDAPSLDTVAGLLLSVLGGNMERTGNGQVYSTEEEAAGKKKKSARLKNPFSMEDAGRLDAELHVGERPVQFCQSQESLLMEEWQGGNRLARINLGNLCHDIFARMETREDEEAAIAEARTKGLLPDKETEDRVRLLIDKAWTIPELCDWFSGKYELLREVTFLTAYGRDQRPDRVMIDRQSKKAIVLDYKFGKQHQADYDAQVRRYMALMRGVGYEQVEGWLWYAEEGQLVKVGL